jgi:D-alanyl-D-alanine dipeptidase
MNFKLIMKFILLCFGLFISNIVLALPQEFVYLKDVVPSIQQDMRYPTYHNFVGRPLKGYARSGECILTRPAATALARVQSQLAPLGLSLKVYDCYRPTMAVADIMVWSKNPKTQQTKAEFYPRVDKADLFKLGYVAEKSGHCRGSTVDLTIVSVPTPKQANYRPGQKLTACFAPYGKRFADNSIDMGTGYDCMDLLSHPSNDQVSQVAFKHRMMLRDIMIKNGFMPIPEEWWHFTLKNEPFPNNYFNFPVA